MNAGKVRISNQLIADALKFPVGWKIEWIEEGTASPSESIMIVSGPEFPETKREEELEMVELVCHMEKVTYEVKRKG
jgi:hypothetical protein